MNALRNNRSNVINRNNIIKSKLTSNSEISIKRVGV